MLFKSAKHWPTYVLRVFSLAPASHCINRDAANKPANILDRWLRLYCIPLAARDKLTRMTPWWYLLVQSLSTGFGLRRVSLPLPRLLTSSLTSGGYHRQFRILIGCRLSTSCKPFTRRSRPASCWPGALYSVQWRLAKIRCLSDFILWHRTTC